MVFVVVNYVMSYSYEDGVSTLRKVSSAADFIWSASPLEVLGSVTSITFNDPADLPIKNHDLTTEEVFLGIYNLFMHFFSNKGV